MYLVLAIIHSEHELEAVSNVLTGFSISRVMVFEGSGIGKNTTLELHANPSFGMEIWRHLHSERQSSWVLLSVIEERDAFRKLLIEVEKITGSLNQPHTAILSTIPLIYAQQLLPENVAT